MTKDELIEFLKDFPGDTKIYYRDMNFGGPEEPLSKEDIEYNLYHKIILVNSFYWEPCD